MGTSAEIIFRKMLPEDVSAAYEIETQSFSVAWSLRSFKMCVESRRYEKFVAM